jgi:hypothetical protein
MNWVAFKEKKFILDSSEGWETQDHGIVDSVSGKGTTY